MNNLNLKRTKVSLIVNIIIFILTIVASVIMFTGFKFMFGYEIVLESTRLGMLRFFTVHSYTIVAGNPAKPIRKRFDDELIKIMEKLKWWDKSIEEINSLIPLLTSRDIAKVKEELLKLI